MKVYESIADLDVRSPDLTGKKYGLLTAVRPTKHSGGHVFWLWSCDCGGQKSIMGTSVVTGRTKSCGCMAGPLVQKRRMTKDAGYRHHYQTFKASAKSRSITFQLSLDEFKEIVGQDCHYCGIEPRDIGPSAKRCRSAALSRTDLPESHYTAFVNGIDRIDSSKDYSKDNIVSCCPFCNMAKRSETAEKFIENVLRVADFQRRQP